MTRLPVAVVGLALVVVGLGCLIVGFVDFFVSGQNMEPPSLFWLWFLGMPLLATGAAMVGWSRRKRTSTRFERAYADFGQLKARTDLHVASEEARDLLGAAQELQSRATAIDTSSVSTVITDEALAIETEFLSPEGVDRIQSSLSAVLAELGPELRSEAATIDAAFTSAAGADISEEQINLVESRVQAFEVQVQQAEAIAQSHLTDLRAAVASLQEQLASAEPTVAADSA